MVGFSNSIFPMLPCQIVSSLEEFSAILILSLVPWRMLDFQAQEWRAQQARPWPREVHPLLQLRKVLPQGTVSDSSCLARGIVCRGLCSMSDFEFGSFLLCVRIRFC